MEVVSRLHGCCVQIVFILLNIEQIRYKLILNNRNFFVFDCYNFVV